MRIFVTGTDTDVGKTVITGLLACHLLSKGMGVRVVKLVATGCTQDKSPDEAFVTAMAQPFAADPDGKRPFSAKTLRCFDFAASPHLAAEMAGQEIDPGALIQALEQEARQGDALLVEGVGGLMVPLSRHLLLADLLPDLGLEAVVVARSWLGTLNHTLLTIDALARRGITTRGVLLNSGGADGVPQGYMHPSIIEDNRRTIQEFTGVFTAGPVPDMLKDEAAGRDPQKGDFVPGPDRTRMVLEELASHLDRICQG